MRERERARDGEREIYITSCVVKESVVGGVWTVDTMAHVVHVIWKVVNGLLPSFIHQFSFVRIIRKLKRICIKSLQVHHLFFLAFSGKIKRYEKCTLFFKVQIHF